jgi:hypothetical protein
LDKLSRIVRSVTAFNRELKRPREKEKPRPRPKIGVALGGGFARGVAHIGVLKVFEEEGIPIDYIAGTSSGAVIAAMFSSGICAKELEEIAGILKFGDFARLTISRLGLWTTDPMISLLTRILKVHTFEELRIPLAVTATDFNSGDSVVFTSGPLVDPLRASCAYPGAFLPLNLKGTRKVDRRKPPTRPPKPQKTKVTEPRASRPRNSVETNGSRPRGRSPFQIALGWRFRSKAFHGRYRPVLLHRAIQNVWPVAVERRHSDRTASRDLCL